VLHSSIKEQSEFILRFGAKLPNATLQQLDKRRKTIAIYDIVSESQQLELSEALSPEELKRRVEEGEAPREYGSRVMPGVHPEAGDMNRIWILTTKRIPNDVAKSGKDEIWFWLPLRDVMGYPAKQRKILRITETLKIKIGADFRKFLD